MVKDIVTRLEKGKYGKRFLFVPKDDSQELLILLSAHNQKNRYFLLRTFLEDQRCNLLFLTDPANSWYLDDDFGQSYINIISEYVARFDKRHVTIFGSSMAGYAALHFSITCNIHCLTCNPQVNLDLSLDYGWHELNQNISKLTSKNLTVSIERLLDCTYYDKVMHIIHGHAPIDVSNVELILGSASPVRKLLVTTLDTDDHAMPFGRDSAKIYEALALMQTYDRFNIEAPDQTTQISVLRENRKISIMAGNRLGHRTLANSAFTQTLQWSRRHALTKPGLYYIEDIGPYDHKGHLVGGPVFFDGEKVNPIFLDNQLPLSKEINLPNGNLGHLSNNQPLSNDNNIWVRVPTEGGLTYAGNSLFNSEYHGSINCYLNWSLRQQFPYFSEGQYLTLYIDLDISEGNVTVGLGGVGKAGYYQVNKTIEASGPHILTFQSTSIDMNHKDAIFCRLYFMPDSMAKIVKIREFKVVRGHFPVLDFFNF